MNTPDTAPFQTQQRSRPKWPWILGGCGLLVLLVVGAEMARAHGELISRATDPIRVDDKSFTVGGVTYAEPSQAVLHTMQYPGRPGRFITVFHSNGEAGWSRLRLIRFYSRDTTIVWEDGRVIDRGVFEPDRRIGITGRN